MRLAFIHGNRHNYDLSKVRLASLYDFEEYDSNSFKKYDSLNDIVSSLELPDAVLLESSIPNVANIPCEKSSLASYDAFSVGIAKTLREFDESLPIVAFGICINRNKSELLKYVDAVTSVTDKKDNHLSFVLSNILRNYSEKV